MNWLKRKITYRRLRFKIQEMLRKGVNKQRIDRILARHIGRYPYSLSAVPSKKYPQLWRDLESVEYRQLQATKNKGGKA